MTEQDFWDIINHSVQEALGNAEKRYRLLKKELEALQPEELTGFDTILNEKIREAGTTDILTACFVVESYVSDDVFENFRAWLVSMGQQNFEATMKDVNAICDFLDKQDVDNINGGRVITLANEIYLEKTGRDIEIPLVKDTEPEQNWPDTKDSLRKLCPRLYDKFWDQAKVDFIHRHD